VFLQTFFLDLRKFFSPKLRKKYFTKYFKELIIYLFIYLFVYLFVYSFFSLFICLFNEKKVACSRLSLNNVFMFFPSVCNIMEKNGFVTATKLWTTNKMFVAATKNFAAAAKRFVDRTKHFVVTKYFCYPYFDK